MTGVIAEFFADLREAWQDERDARRRARQARSDPLVDLRTVPRQILRPIQRWADDYLAIPRSERRMRLFGMQFTICRYRRGPLIRQSELMAVFGRLTQLSAASERAARQQTAELEAESGLAVAKGHTDNLKARLIRATQAQAEMAQQLDEARAENKARERQVADLIAAKENANQHINDLMHELNVLEIDVLWMTADRQTMEEDREDLHRCLAQLFAVGKDLLTDHENLAEQVKNLRADKQVLEDVNGWLQEKLRLRGEAPRAA